MGFGFGRKTPNPPRVWLDVGAHAGEKTLAAAKEDPALRVYAFEPILELAATLLSAAPNYFVAPVAVSDHDGVAEFYLNSFDAASSLLPFDEDGLSRWRSPDELKVAEKRVVPCVRLDTFLDRAQVDRVDFLKIDAQGADLAVVRSAGERLRNIRRVSLEVQVTERLLYAGSAGKDETVRFLEQTGFVLESTERQSLGQEENLTFVNMKLA